MKITIFPGKYHQNGSKWWIFHGYVSFREGNPKNDTLLSYTYIISCFSLLFRFGINEFGNVDWRIRIVALNPYIEKCFSRVAMFSAIFFVSCAQF